MLRSRVRVAAGSRAGVVALRMRSGSLVDRSRPDARVSDAVASARDEREGRPMKERIARLVWRFRHWAAGVPRLNYPLMDEEAGPCKVCGADGLEPCR
jgi:hypothetical protein